MDRHRMHVSTVKHAAAMDSQDDATAYTISPFYGISIHGFNKVVSNATLGDLAGTREGFLHLLQYGCRFQLTRLQYINSTCATTDSLRGFILPSLASSFCTFFLFAGTKFTHWGPGIGRIAQRDVLHRAYTYAFPRYFLPKTIDTMWYRYCNDTVHTA
jgi:hypothetical protein